MKIKTKQEIGFWIAIGIGTAAGLAAALALSTPAEAQDYSNRNDGLTKKVQCSNVPARSGSVPGLFISGIGYIVEEAYADRVTVEVAGVMPVGLSSKDSREAEAYLHSVGLTNYELVIRREREERLVETVAPRGVADGSTHTQDNLTSMGQAVSDGATILRVRSTTAQDVEIRKAGGGTETVTVGAGDTLVAVDGGGTYIATFSESGRKITKATGPQAFNDLTEVAETFSRNGDWCK